MSCDALIAKAAAAAGMSYSAAATASSASASSAGKSSCPGLIASRRRLPATAKARLVRQRAGVERTSTASRTRSRRTASR